jgi:hypothetical protein
MRRDCEYLNNFEKNIVRKVILFNLETYYTAMEIIIDI